jgi:hypothetical protein
MIFSTIASLPNRFARVISAFTRRSTSAGVLRCSGSVLTET